jgi:hypothetical protein
MSIFKKNIIKGLYKKISGEIMDLVYFLTCMYHFFLHVSLRSEIFSLICECMLRGVELNVGLDTLGSDQISWSTNSKGKRYTKKGKKYERYDFVHFT